MRSVTVAVAAVLGLSAPAWPQAGLLVPTSVGRPDATVLSLRDMQIDVGLARGYARVNVRQIFENHTKEILEGTYRFGLPPSAAVGDFAVWDGMTRIPGVILEKQRARAIYRELTTQRIDPGLLQQGEEEEVDAGAGPNATRPSGGALFSVRVAPIPAWATKRLELQFQQEIPIVRGQGELRIVLRPPDGEPLVAGHLVVHVVSEDGGLSVPSQGLPLSPKTGERALRLDAEQVTLDRDLLVRVNLDSGNPLVLSAFRNPDGHLPDGLALAPWERPSEIPPDKDGFFLLILDPPAAPTDAERRGASARQRAPVHLAAVFDTSLSHRWSGLESAYAQLVRVLDSLGPDDRFTLVPFDETPAPIWDGLRPATAEATADALGALRARSLGPGTRLLPALRAARSAVGADGRVLLLSDGTGPLPSSQEIHTALGGAPMFAALTGTERPEALQAGSLMCITATTASIEADLFFERLLAPIAAKASTEESGPPFRVTLGDPKLRDVHPVLLQPPAAGAWSGWIGRYAVPVEHLRWELTLPDWEGKIHPLDQGLPEKDLSARDLPRRWARAQVDFLLQQIESEGERRDWIDQIIALSKRYKFVTPYTAFLAAPRSLLRPRRIQPGDPVLRVSCDPAITRAVALLPFGVRLPLVRRPGTSLWEGRFLAPDGIQDGRYAVRILLTDASGIQVTERKHFVLDGTRPTIHPEPPAFARAGTDVRVAARADSDVVVLTARLGDGPPVPLRWDPKARRNVGRLHIPRTVEGEQPLFFEAIDGAKNHGFARSSLEVQP